MKKLLLKKLQSLTAILVLNTLPAGLAQASIGYDAQVSQARILSDDRKNALKNAYQEDPFKRLCFENSLAYIQKQTGSSRSYQYQLSLAYIEEAYQDDLDTLLDHYESELSDAIASKDPMLIEKTKRWAEEEIIMLKEMRKAKISEFNQEFSIS